MPFASLPRRAVLAFALLAIPSMGQHLGAQSISITVRDSARVFALPGSTLRVPIVLDFSAAGGANLAALQATLYWDDTLLQIDSIRAVDGSGFVGVGVAVAGGVRLSVYAASGVRQGGPFLDAYFTARAASGGTWVSLVPEVAGDETGRSVLPLLRLRQLGVCVSPDVGLWGDASADGVVNILDAQQIARLAVGLSVVQPVAAAARGDVTADGRVDVIDAQQVARYSVGLSAVDRVGREAYVPPAVASLTLDRTWLATLPLESWLQVTATPRAADGSSLAGCQPVAWSSSSASTASVTPTGQVVAAAAGSATATATSGGRTAALPVTVFGLPPAVDQALAVSSARACRLGQAGQLACWGGIVALPTSIVSPVPFSAFAQDGGRSCGLTPAGRAYCWGGSGVGDGTSLSRAAPTAVRGDLTFTTISVGPGNAEPHACALTPVGQAYCWGNNSFGKLGDGTTTARLLPTPVTGGLTFAALSADFFHTCGLTAGGKAYCWGNNLRGGLGHGGLDNRSVPTAVAGNLTFTHLTTGYYHTCGLTPNGVAFCWGGNQDGELGDNSTQDRLVPTLVAGGLVFRSLTAGNGRTCGLTPAGVAYCWGATRRQADPSTIVTDRVTAPQLVPGGLTFSTLQVNGTSPACGITTAGLTYCWGRNTSGEVGDGTTIERLVPTLVLNNGLAAASLLPAGPDRAMARGPGAWLPRGMTR